MGKRIIQQRRGKGSPTYRVKERAYTIKTSYPKIEGKGTILKLINSSGYTAPFALIKVNDKTFFNIATENLSEGDEIEIGEKAKIKNGNILPLKNIPEGTDICNIETNAFGGGKMVRTSGSSAKVVKKIGKEVAILLPSKKEMVLSGESRATIGKVAGGGRTEKPIVKAGKKFFYLKARGKHYPRTSPIKRNAVNHPFGGGRGKNMGKSSIVPRWAPPGRKVGLLRPRKTGRGR
ncbi:MAG: 50S ribosomal protein L2 [Candidatus Pacearchaeota archaeon]